MPAQIRANASAFAGKPVTLDAASLAERGPATVERSALFHFVERREKLIHLPIVNELLSGFISRIPSRKRATLAHSTWSDVAAASVTATRSALVKIEGRIARKTSMALSIPCSCWGRALRRFSAQGVVVNPIPSRVAAADSQAHGKIYVKIGATRRRDLVVSTITTSLQASGESP